MESKSWSRRGFRLGAELLVIVVGVLIALSADAWWDQRQDRQAEVRHLTSLREDLKESLLLLDESDRSRASMMDALAHISSEDLDRVPVDSVAQWVYVGLFSLFNYAPQLTALADLRSSDQLRVLTPEVRRGIADLDRRMADHERLQADLTTSQQGVLDPYLVDHLPLAAILAVADTLPLTVRLAATPDWSSLRSTQLRNAIAFKLSLAKDSGRYRATLAQSMRSVIDLIDERLIDLVGEAD